MPIGASLLRLLGATVSAIFVRVCGTVWRKREEKREQAERMRNVTGQLVPRKGSRKCSEQARVMKG